MKKLVIILPVYNEEDILPLTIKKMKSLMSELIKDKKISSSSQVCFVNDGSSDNSWNIINQACLSDKMISSISKLKPKNYPANKKFYISIELGFQTSKESSANFIRRGYENSIYTDAVARLHKIAPEIHVVTHLIFGLPEESFEDMINSVNFVLKSQTDGIKFTVLHVLENTDLAILWKEGKFQTMSQDEYFEVLKSALQNISEFYLKTKKQIVVHRFTGDGAKKILLSPMWTANKKKVLNDIKKYILQN